MNTKTNISAVATRNYDAIAFNTRSAYEMALSSHNLSADGTYARTSDGSLWIWSDRRSAWVQIDFQEVVK